jgi:hypothetical protein
VVDAWLARRRNELRAISNTEPARLIALYRFVTGMVVSTEPPRCTSFTTMIETILDRAAQFRVPECRSDNQGNFPQGRS